MSEAAEKLEQTKKLLDAADDSNEELLTVKTVFPFKLLPDQITIDREQITIKKTPALGSHSVVTVKLTDLTNVEHSGGPFLATLKIYSKFMTEGAHEIRKLSKGDAEMLHRVLQGYLLANEKSIDCSVIPKDELLVLLSDLGKPANL